MKSQTFSQWAWLMWLIGLSLAFCAYRLTAPPGLTWAHGGGDGGELTVASAFLGVAHPPGYPLYTLTGWVALNSLPGSPAVRMTVLSHLFALLAAAGIALCARHLALRWGLPAPDLLGLGAGMALTFNRLVWEQAIIIEVYTLTLALFGALLWLADRAAAAPPEQRSRHWLLFALGHVLGVAVTHHLTAALWGIVLLTLLWRPRLRDLAWLALGGITGLWAWLLLLARAGSAPQANWGGVETGFAAFFEHITAQIYRIYLRPFTLEQWGDSLRVLLELLISSFTWVGGLLLLAGIIGGVASRRWRWLAASALLTLALVTLTSIYTAQDTAQAYGLPVVALGAVWIGLGIGEIAHLFDALRLKRLPAVGVIGALIGVLVCTMALTHWNALDLSSDDEPARFLERFLVDVPDDAVVIVDTDHPTFTLWYYQFAEPILADRIVINRPLWQFAWYRSAVARLYPALPPPTVNLLEWLSAPEFAALPIASNGFFNPFGGRRVRPIGDWYVMMPASG